MTQASDPTDSQSIERTPDPSESKLSTTQTTKLEKALIYMAYRGGRWLGDRFVTPRQADERIHEDMLKTLPELAALIQSEASRIALEAIGEDEPEDKAEHSGVTCKGCNCFTRNKQRRLQRTKLKALTAPEGGQSDA